MKVTLFQNLAGEREILKAHVVLGHLHPRFFFWIQLYWIKELNEGEEFQSYFFYNPFLRADWLLQATHSVQRRWTANADEDCGCSRQRAGYAAPLPSNSHFSRAWLSQRDWSPGEGPQDLWSCNISWFFFLRSKYFIFMGAIKNSELWLVLR